MNGMSKVLGGVLSGVATAETMKKVAEPTKNAATTVWNVVWGVMWKSMLVNIALFTAYFGMWVFSNVFLNDSFSMLTPNWTLFLAFLAFFVNPMVVTFLQVRKEVARNSVRRARIDALVEEEKARQIAQGMVPVQTHQQEQNTTTDPQVSVPTEAPMVPVQPSDAVTVQYLDYQYLGK